MKINNSNSNHLFRLFLAGILLTIQLSQQAHAQNEKPNFIIIFTDDQGYGDLGCYGNPTIKTTLIKWRPKGRSGQISM